ncbi:ATP synthase subunit g, mitochondrial-like [Lytechinus variegatus]|uniref:ATP synthase subunit g, mitochondrial-like n=1 Tax=Lytechinus variegatus TaxID=7654 RepID=UPI001BB1C6BA|nr:ATP synthase subunit g, mitochondrial-like [Lytechinus variegatus]
MARAAQKVVGLGTRLGNSLATQGPKLATEAVEYSKPRLSKFWYYAKVELVPPTPGEFPAIQKGISDIIKSARTGKFANLTVKEAWANTLVCAEVAFWFFIGEQIGRRSIVGYNVKSDYEPHPYI